MKVGDSMSEKTEGSEGAGQFVGFKLADEEYGISILRVQEIIRYESLTGIPQSETFVEGVLNLRGRVIPVIDLRKRFKLPQSNHDVFTRIIVIELEIQVVGIIVDSVTEVRILDRSQINPPPPMGAQVDTRFIDGIGKLEDRLIILLNIDLILNQKEKAVLAEAAV